MEPVRAMAKMTLWAFTIMIVSCGWIFNTVANAKAPHDSGNSELTGLVVGIGKQVEQSQTMQFNSFNLAFPVIVHNPTIAGSLKNEYSSQDLNALFEMIKETVSIKVNNGIVQAADRDLEGGSDPTNYNAVWVRDSLWSSMGLKSRPETESAGVSVLVKLLNYISSDAQLKRFEKVIADPKIIDSEAGTMEVVHIRFDGSSDTFEDVQVNGKPQKWNHKQNDALGLLFDLVLRAIRSGEIRALSEPNWKALLYLPVYFSRIKFYEMRDAGSWEEIERVNSSSIGLVTSSLENLSGLLYAYGNQAHKAFADQYLARAKDTTVPGTGLVVSEFVDKNSLSILIDSGYHTIVTQLNAGGESPLHKEAILQRGADAALLNLIFPARLSRLQTAQKIQILGIVESLVGQAGIRRYLGDSYQNGNSWLRGGDTDDHSSSEDFSSRAKASIPNSEAQWFFDSWMSVCYGLVYRQTKLNEYRAQQTRFLNRALGQITGGTSSDKYLGADGKPVPPFALPESYNVISQGSASYFVPSPITPLNWAKASLTLALESY